MKTMNDEQAGSSTSDVLESRLSEPLYRVEDSFRNPLDSSQEKENESNMNINEQTSRANLDREESSDFIQSAGQIFGEGQEIFNRNIRESPARQYNLPLLAPLLFNRPPFDVEDFRRRLASTHRPENGSAVIQENDA